MGRGILAAELRRFGETGKRVEENPEWKRREGFNLTCEFADAIKSAFELFFFQHMSMPGYQASPDRGKRLKNAENILKMKEIPCNNRITRLIDGIAPGEFDWNFRDGLGSAGNTAFWSGTGCRRRRFDSSRRRIILRKKCVADTVCTSKERENSLLPQHNGGGYSAPRRGCGAASGA